MKELLELRNSAAGISDEHHPSSRFLTRRKGTWYFVRRVPLEFSHLDRRVLVRHSTKIRVADDKYGRRAARVAQAFNHALEAEWKALSDGWRRDDYARVRGRVMSIGLEYPHQPPVAVLAGPAAPLSRSAPDRKKSIIRRIRDLLGGIAK